MPSAFLPLTAPLGFHPLYACITLPQKEFPDVDKDYIIIVKCSRLADGDNHPIHPSVHPLKGLSHFGATSICDGLVVQVLESD